MDRETSRAPVTNLSVTSLVLSCALLAVVIAPAAVAIAWIATGQFSSSALQSAAVGGGVCWFAGALALTVTFLGNQLQAPVPGMLVAMMFRMGLPLAAIIVLPKLGGPLGAASVTATIVGVYMIALIVETGLSLRMIQPAARAVKAA